MFKISFSLLLLFTSFYSSAQKYYDKMMKKTADKLLSSLREDDTAAIVRLNADYYLDDEDDKPTEREYNEGLMRILEDCKTYQKFIKKYGTPKRKNYTISDGINGGKQLIVTISSKPDTILNRSYCKLVIQFYPITILNPEVFYGYRFDTGPLLKRIPLQTIPVNKNN